MHILYTKSSFDEAQLTFERAEMSDTITFHSFPFGLLLRYR